MEEQELEKELEQSTVVQTEAQVNTNEQQKTEYLIDIQKVLDYLKQDITKISIKIIKKK